MRRVVPQTQEINHNANVGAFEVILTVGNWSLGEVDQFDFRSLR